MFEFVVVLCVVFVASPVIAEEDTVILDPEYLTARRDWLEATETAQMSMDSCWTMINAPGITVINVHRTKLKAVTDYEEATMRYANKTLDEILRLTEKRQSKLREDLNFYTDKIEHDVEDLFFQFRNVTMYACRRYASSDMTKRRNDGEHLLAITQECIENHASNAPRLHREIVREIFHDETKRIDEVWQYVLNCTVDGTYAMSVTEAVACFNMGKRQIARGSVSLVKDVREKMEEMKSSLDNISGVTDGCASSAGLTEYYRRGNDIVDSTRKCIGKRLIGTGPYLAFD